MFFSYMYNSISRKPVPVPVPLLELSSAAQSSGSSYSDPKSREEVISESEDAGKLLSKKCLQLSVSVSLGWSSDQLWDSSSQDKAEVSIEATFEAFVPLPYA